MEAIQTKLENLQKERETVVATLQKLKSDYELNTRNIDRIDGAIFILNEQLTEKKEANDFSQKEVKEPKKSKN